MFPFQSALPGTDGVRAAILDDLSTHSGLTSDNQYARVLPELGIVERRGWCAADRSDVED